MYSQFKSGDIVAFKNGRYFHNCYKHFLVLGESHGELILSTRYVDSYRWMIIKGYKEDFIKADASCAKFSNYEIQSINILSTFMYDLIDNKLHIYNEHIYHNYVRTQCLLEFISQHEFDRPNGMSISDYIKSLCFRYFEEYAAQFFQGYFKKENEE